MLQSSSNKKSHLDLASNEGYFFFIESLFYLEKLNYKVVIDL